jgi:hypothetical protein
MRTACFDHARRSDGYALQLSLAGSWHAIVHCLYKQAVRGAVVTLFPTIKASHFPQPTKEQPQAVVGLLFARETAGHDLPIQWRRHDTNNVSPVHMSHNACDV